ncbi:MAG: hypothetical protein ACTHOD_01125 [Motilibacteraceae bacterium]
MRPLLRVPAGVAPARRSGRPAPATELSCSPERCPDLPVQSAPYVAGRRRVALSESR